MTQNLAHKLIKHYTEVLNEVKSAGENFWEIKLITARTHTDFGICACAKSIFRSDINYDTWIEAFPEYENGKGFWFDTPFRCRTIESIIEVLQLRLDRLKTFSENNKFSNEDNEMIF